MTVLQGYTREVSGYLMDLYRGLGYEPELTVKGGVVVKIADGECSGADGCRKADPAAGAIMLEAHVDTLGLWWLRYLQREGCILLLSGNECE